MTNVFLGHAGTLCFSVDASGVVSISFDNAYYVGLNEQALEGLVLSQPVAVIQFLQEAGPLLRQRIAGIEATPQLTDDGVMAGGVVYRTKRADDELIALKAVLNCWNKVEDRILTLCERRLAQPA